LPTLKVGAHEVETISWASYLKSLPSTSTIDENRVLITRALNKIIFSVIVQNPTSEKLFKNFSDK